MSPDLTARGGTIHLSTGVRLHYTERGDAGGHATLFPHGYTDSAYAFSPILPLVPPTFRTVAIDQRGHGDSETESSLSTAPPSCLHSAARP